MKAIALFILLSTTLCPASFAQYIFDLKGKNTQSVTDYEKAAKGKLITLAKNFVESPGIGQPLVYLRKEKLMPDLLVYYFPNTADATINYILYEWDETNFTSDEQAVKQPLARLKPYIDKYLFLTKQASSFFGKAETSGSVEDVDLIASGRFQRKDFFSKDGITAEMYIVLSNKEETNGIVSIRPTHRIRMYIRTPSAE